MMVFVKKIFLSKILHVVRKILLIDHKTVFLFKIGKLFTNKFTEYIMILI